jgi:hypothetical protein
MGQHRRFAGTAKPMLTAQQLEERAEEALALAPRMRNAEARQAMIETARRYELLALRAAKREQAERKNKNRAA